MYKVLKVDKDSYITNRYIKMSSSGSFRTGSNVGAAGTLDLFKLYGTTFDADRNPNLELSRLLIHFDLQPIKDLISEGKLNIAHSSFNCHLKLFDVYGGQTTPSNFDISVFPLSRSFDEGNGRDVVYYSDYDACNFISSSIGTTWVGEGCTQGGGAEEICDYITGSINIDDETLEVTQRFSTGEEDLNVNITTIISATLSNVLPDSGFRLSLKASQEQDQYSYFVKRFASKSAYDTSKHPKLIVRYDDSEQDDSQNLRFDENSTLFLRNYSHGQLSNILSGSSLTEITGDDCVLLRLSTTLSDGSGEYSIYFTGSQHSDGLNYKNGIYSSSFTIPTSNSSLNQELIKSGSVIFTPIWESTDNSIAYFTGSNITVYPPHRTNTLIDFKKYTITTSGLQTLHRSDENIFIRLNIFDHTSPLIKLVKKPIELSGIVVKNAHYQIRDISTNEVLIPFDETYNSTKISSDASGMYFILDSSNLIKERSYVIDALLIFGTTKKIFKAVSNAFKISDTQTN